MSDVRSVRIGHTRSSPSTAGRSRTTQSPFLQRGETRLLTGYAQPSPEPRTSRLPVVCGICVCVCRALDDSTKHCTTCRHAHPLIHHPCSLPPLLRQLLFDLCPCASWVLGSRPHTSAHKRVCNLLDAMRCTM
eukprot:4343961-Prymnesium_polylepis.1